MGEEIEMDGETEEEEKGVVGVRGGGLMAFAGLHQNSLKLTVQLGQLLLSNHLSVSSVGDSGRRASSGGQHCGGAQGEHGGDGRAAGARLPRQHVDARTP